MSLFDEDELAKEEAPSFLLYSREEIVEYAYAYYRETGFPYRELPVHMCMQELNALAAMQHDQRALNSVLGYQIADTYHKHRFACHANGKVSPEFAFNDETYKSKDGRDRLRIALDLLMENTGKISTGYFGTLSLVRGTQSCSNFRPSFAKYLYDEYAKDGVVLDTSTGYGGRLVGFMASTAAHYVGIDPNTLTHDANSRMVRDLDFAPHVKLINKPAEDVTLDEIGAEEYDFAFTSPPYFCKEEYSEQDTQSWKRYGTGEAWRDGFLKKMLELQFAALKDGTTNIVNIAPVKIRSKTYPLDEWTIQLGQEIGFKYIETRKFMLGVRMGANLTDEQAYEPVIVFKKG